MKIVTLVGKSPEEIDNLVNEFEADNTVKATQTHIDHDKGLYSYVLFYIPAGKNPVVKHTIVKG